MCICPSVDCGDPPVVVNSETLTKVDTLEGDTATYRCPAGQAYDELNSYEAVLTCNASGDWDGLKPTCTGKKRVHVLLMLFTVW